MNEDLSGFAGPRGLGPDEKVPNELRILAMRENLGNLLSVHRPATRLARLALKQARVYLFDHGFVVASGRGALGLFRWERLTVTAKGEVWLVAAADGGRFQVTRHWTEHAELGRAVEQAVARVQAG